MDPRTRPRARLTFPILATLVAGTCGLVACGSDDQPPPGNGTAGAGAPAGSGSGGAAAMAGMGNGGVTGGAGATAGSGGSPSATGGAAGGFGGAAGSPGGGAGTAGASSGAGGAAGAGGSAPVSCPAAPLAKGNSNKTLQFGGKNRKYVLHVPSGYDGTKPVPLILDFHGLGGSGEGQSGGSPYAAETDAEGVIMAFPSGEPGPSGGAWNVGPCCVSGVDDVAFAKSLVSEIAKSACIDPKRVYAVGFSMGGGMSHYLACHAADVFAAVAPAAFDLLEENVDDCQPSRPISVVSFRGTGDAVVPYAGGYSAVVSGMPITFMGAQKTFETWADLNQCTGSASAEDAKGCKSYGSCQGGVDVMLCTKQAGGHEAGNASVAWPILKKHTLP